MMKYAHYLAINIINCIIVPYENHKFQKITKEIDHRLQSEDESDSFIINVYGINIAINRPKTGKSDGEEGLYADHIIICSSYVIVYNAMIVHGMCPKSIIIGTMIPISKVKKQVVCNSDNVRAVALSSRKILNRIILMREK